MVFWEAFEITILLIRFASRINLKADGVSSKVKVLMGEIGLTCPLSISPIS